MKKYIKKSIGLVLSAALVISFTACEKQAEAVEGLGGTETSAASATSDTSATNDTADTTQSGDADADNEVTGTWEEVIEPADMDFKKITIKAAVEEYTGVNKVVTVQADDYDSDFAKDMCGKIFDGDVEVFDYSAKTKKLYDKEIALYNLINSMYQDEDAGMIIESMESIDSEIGSIYEVNIADIEDTIAKLEAEKDSAPDTIENDFSYGGYIGNVGGEEFYMYLGNRNYEEYYDSPLSIDFDGRVVTVFRNDVSSLFNGTEGYIAEYGSSGGTGVFENPPEAILDMADQFVDEIGFSDYQRSGESGGFTYRRGIDNSVCTSLGLSTTSYVETEVQTGYVIKYTMGGMSYPSINTWGLQMDMYVDDHDAFSYYSYISVFVTDNGVAGAQLANPLTIKNMEDVSSIISINDAKDVIIHNVEDIDAWNTTEVYISNYPEFDTFQMMSFPIRSDEDSHEYTFVPAYILYNSQGGTLSYDSTTVSQALHYAPFMIVNALDGSIIKVNDELSNHPTGYYNNGNIGYDEFQSYGWERQQGLFEDYMDVDVIQVDISDDNEEE